jgi:squalene-hopene/tetraprenyl-beta-curcumene cyclase
MRICKSGRPLRQTAVLLLLSGAAFAAGGSAIARAPNPWNPKAAAAYLDRRIEWWIRWPGSARDSGTFCISCHTAAPYALARPALRSLLGEAGPSRNEQLLLQNVTKRVRLWSTVKPFYGGSNSARSRGTEAVLDAWILASSDVGNSKLSENARAALDNMWSAQRTIGEATGSWNWLDFENEPWEAPDSSYYGAAVAALAVGEAPASYRADPTIQSRLGLLRNYLNREFDRQSPINQVVALWASVNWSGLLAPEHRTALLRELKHSHQADGGWSMASLLSTWSGWNIRSLARFWIRSEATPLHPRSDGYATGLITFVLQQLGDADDPDLIRARAWMAGNQDRNQGSWPAYSPNGKRDHASGEGLFMTDAATAYAALALSPARGR